MQYLLANVNDKDDAETRARTLREMFGDRKFVVVPNEGRHRIMLDQEGTGVPMPLMEQMRSVAEGAYTPPTPAAAAASPDATKGVTYPAGSVQSTAPVHVTNTAPATGTVGGAETTV